MTVIPYTVQVTRCESTDEKPNGLLKGNVLVENDTGNKYDWNGESWILRASSGGATFAVSGATVVDAQASPTSWTDLDLSGTVGANSALVILAISATGDMNAVSVRKNGDTDEYYNASVEANAYGCALGHHDSDAVLALICITDTAGVIEWITETSSTATIKLIAYVK